MTLPRPCQQCELKIENPGKKQRYCDNCIKERERKGADTTNTIIRLALFSEKSIREMRSQISNLKKEIQQLKGTIPNPSG